MLALLPSIKPLPLKKILITLFVCSSLAAFGQVADTTKKLNEIEIKGYYNPQQLLRTVAAVSILDSSIIINQPQQSLVSLLNTAAGVRMEERSPGSYRLSLRGSLLRSPFGIRNIKIYMDDFPLTDAGGNTYLNALDLAGVGKIEIYKGPEASIFGTNTGGAVLISTPNNRTNNASISLTGGSYGLLHQTASLQRSFANYNFSLTQGYQQSDGYRENSAMKRKYIQTAHQWDYSARGNLKAFLFYSDLNYQTPGGLNAAQFAINPRLARQATATTPSAIQQQAGIFNKTFYAGLANNYSFAKNFRHVLALFTSYTDFENPFIRNYEKRIESTLGLRTFLEYNFSRTNLKANLQTGIEALTTPTNFKNYGNDSGTRTALTVADDLKANQNFAFLRANIDINKKLNVEIGSSLNFFNYKYQSYFPLAVAENQKKFSSRFMPKIATSYLLQSNLAFRASASKGYSPPTLAEVRSSDNVINTDLAAEVGWNYETGLRYVSKNKRIYIDGTLFYYNLKDAIVRRLSNNDIEYFINAGGTKQLGTELQVAFWLIKNDGNSFINSLQLRNSFTYSHFKFDNFINASQDFSGNNLTGVPKHTVVSSLSFDFIKGFYFFAQHNYTSAIPLNDANTVYAKKYHLVDLKTGIRNLKIMKAKFDINAGINNVLNQTYSLGNDLNAANGLYFNTAAKINFYTGIAVKM